MTSLNGFVSFFQWKEGEAESWGEGTDGARYSRVPTALVILVAGVKKRAEPKSVRTTREPATLLVQRMLSGFFGF